MGKVQMDLGDMRTSILNAMMGLGIGLGCVVAAVLSKHKMRTSLIHIGSWGLAASLTAASFIAVMPSGIGLQFWLLGAALLAGGFFGGWIAVPLQVFIQVRPKAEQKGRVIAAMNLITWCGILSASIYYFLSLAFTGFSMPPSYILASLGLLMIISHSIMYPKFIRHLQDENSTGLETAPLQAIGGLTK
jgi:acyl-[acyl-carrier-protein]-phospholipid O-acyltransferase/long-chain-fatty-acid--[acyl-carrier-protein] ligase